MWIGAPWDAEEFDCDNVPPAPVFRKEFKCNKPVRKAGIKICGLGLFELSLNGIKVGDDVLVPNESSYTFRPRLDENPILPLDGTQFKNYRVYYLEYDLTEKICQGNNLVEVLLGNGFFSTDSRRFVQSYGTPRLICRIDIEYEDGSVDRVVTDRSWRVAKSPLLMNDLFDGEIYDARLEGKQEWTRPVRRKAPQGRLMLQTGPSDKVVRSLAPVSVKDMGEGEWEVDFGETVTGWVSLSGLRSIPRGHEIEVVYPRAEYGNGIQKYISSGRRSESYSPRFTWYTFSKVLVRGYENPLQARQLRADVVHSDIASTGEFECSDELINKINEVWRRTQLLNMHMGVPTDCPHRERGPYTGDGQVSCVTVMHNFDADAFYRKWLRDISDCQLSDGYVPNGAPWHVGCGGGVPWGAAMNIIPWEHYLHYGDISVLEEHFQAMKAQLEWMRTSILPDGTMLQARKDKNGKELKWFNLGEWCAPYNTPERGLVHSYYLWKCADYTARAAKVLGLNEDAAVFSDLAENTAEAFHRKFYNPSTRSYGNNDGSNVFALDMGVPDSLRSIVLGSLKQEIKANGGHLNTGIYGTRLFFEVLCRYGLEDMAYEAMTKTDWPSYGYALAQGSDTMWEFWDGRNSRVHPMFGGGLVWLYRNLAGVWTDESQPGYKHIIIKPQPAGKITWVRYSTLTRYGTVAVRWERSAGRFRMSVDIPEGSTATVYMPTGGRIVELSSGHYEL